MIPFRPFIDTSDSERIINLVSVEEALKNWLFANRCYCIIIGGPGYCPACYSTSKYCVRCFGLTPFQDVNSRDCMTNAVGNAFFLFLGEGEATQLFNRIPEFIRSSSSGSRSAFAGHVLLSDLLRIGHLSLIFQAAGGYIGLKKMRLPGHGHKEEPSIRFDWLFEKAYYGRVYIIRLYEAGIVDHVVLLDSRR